MTGVRDAIAARYSAKWLLVAGVALVLFGAAGSRFSFGVFLRPLTEEFDWSRGSLSGALALAGLSTAVLRPFAGMLADRYDPRLIAAVGMAIGGAALLGLSRIDALWQLYTLFIMMGIGFTLASPATLTGLISARFTRNRSLALSLAGSGSAIGETALVPLSAVAISIGGWRSAYVVLGVLMIAVLIPLSSLLMSSVLRRNGRDNGKQDGRDVVAPGNASASSEPRCAWAPDQGLSLRQAVRTRLFWALALGFFT